MSGYLIIYSSTDGHTKIICEKIRSISKNSSSIKIVKLSEANHLNLQIYEHIIIGASIRYGKHNKNLYKFISSNKEILEKKRSVFFSVNVVARKPEKNTPETNPYIIKFLKKVEWEPTKKAVFAGRLDYPSLDCANKLAILFIMIITNGPKDISQVYELTDWGKVDELISSISKF